MKGKDKIYLMVFSLIPTTLNEIFPNIDPQYTTKTAIAAITFTVVIFGTVIYNSFIVKHEEKAPKIVSRDAETNTDISTLANPQTEPSLLDSKTRLCNITINENISEEIYLKHAMKTKGTKIENGDKVVEWLNFKSKPYTSTPDMSLNWFTVDGNKAPDYIQPYYKTVIEYKIDTKDPGDGSSVKYIKTTEYIPYHPLDYDRTMQDIMGDIVVKSAESTDQMESKEYISKRIGNLFDLIQSKQTIYPELDHTNIKLTNWLYNYTSNMTEPIDDIDIDVTTRDIHDLISFVSKTKSAETIHAEPSGIWATFSTEDLIDLSTHFKPRRTSVIFELKPIKEDEIETLIGNIKEEMIIHKTEIGSDWVTDLIIAATDIRK